MLTHYPRLIFITKNKEGRLVGFGVLPKTGIDYIWLSREFDRLIRSAFNQRKYTMDLWLYIT